MKPNVDGCRAIFVALAAAGVLLVIVLIVLALMRA